MKLKEIIPICDKDFKNWIKITYHKYILTAI